MQLGIPLPYHRAGPWALRQLQGHLWPSQIQWRSACRSTPAGVDTYTVATTAFDFPLTRPKRTHVQGLDVVQLTTCGQQTPTASSQKRTQSCAASSIPGTLVMKRATWALCTDAALPSAVLCTASRLRSSVAVSSICQKDVNLRCTVFASIHRCVYTQALPAWRTGAWRTGLNHCKKNCPRRSITDHGMMPRSFCHVVAVLGMKSAPVAKVSQAPPAPLCSACSACELVLVPRWQTHVESYKLSWACAMQA